jgi:hypothetical protein
MAFGGKENFIQEAIASRSPSVVDAATQTSFQQLNKDVPK